MKSIFVPVLGSKSDFAVLEAAKAVARQFESHIQATHVRPNVLQKGMSSTLGAGGHADSFWDQLAEEIKQNAAQAHRNFESFRDRAHLHLAQNPDFVRGATASWSEVEGLLVESVARMSRYHDLTVLHRPESYYGFMPADTGEVLMQSGRPVLLVPTRLADPSFKTVCVAWKDSAEAARAVTAAMPLIEKASKLIVAGVVEENTLEAVRASLERVADAFRWRAIEPEIACLPTKNQSATLELRDFARKAGVDLIVMGGYGHSRAREFLFGGMTREMLDSGDIPLLLAH